MPGVVRGEETISINIPAGVSEGMQLSMSGKGNCYDNAVAESFFSSLKNEIVHHRDYHTRDQARSEIFEYIELFYNRKRIHQSLNYQTPVQYESLKLSTN